MAVGSVVLPDGDGYGTISHGAFAAIPVAQCAAIVTTGARAIIRSAAELCDLRQAALGRDGSPDPSGVERRASPSRVCWRP